MLKYSWDSFVSKVPVNYFYIKNFDDWRGEAHVPPPQNGKLNLLQLKTFLNKKI